MSLESEVGLQLFVKLVKILRCPGRGDCPGGRPRCRCDLLPVCSVATSLAPSPLFPSSVKTETQSGHIPASEPRAFGAREASSRRGTVLGACGDGGVESPKGADVRRDPSLGVLLPSGAGRGGCGSVGAGRQEENVPVSSSGF